MKRQNTEKLEAISLLVYNDRHKWRSVQKKYGFSRARLFTVLSKAYYVMLNHAISQMKLISEEVDGE